MDLENGVNNQVNGFAVQMDGGRTHVIVFTQYLCALNEADVGWRGWREPYRIHVESSC